jgi:activating signal cointegrator 1
VAVAKVKVLSLNPPYATLIAACQRYPELGKHIETRGWSTNYRGDLLIHQTAGLGTMFADEDDLATFCAAEPFRSTLAALGITEAAQLPRGLIIAKVNLVDVRPIPEFLPRWMGYTTPDAGYEWHLTERERAFGNYKPGRYGLLLADIQALATPIPARGMPGLWEFDL